MDKPRLGQPVALSECLPVFPFHAHAILLYVCVYILYHIYGLAFLILMKEKKNAYETNRRWTMTDESRGIPFGHVYLILR